MTLFADLGPIEHKKLLNSFVILDKTSVTVPFTFNDSGVDCFLDLRGSTDRMISQV